MDSRIVEPESANKAFFPSKKILILAFLGMMGLNIASMVIFGLIGYNLFSDLPVVYAEDGLWDPDSFLYFNLSNFYVPIAFVIALVEGLLFFIVSIWAFSVLNRQAASIQKVEEFNSFKIYFISLPVLNVALLLNMVVIGARLVFFSSFLSYLFMWLVVLGFAFLPLSLLFIVYFSSKIKERARNSQIG
ncbi:MAG: hypothetical protein ACFFBD_20070 [Candidatus Hodarchaeota archaeon]